MGQRRATGRTCGLRLPPMGRGGRVPPCCAQGGFTLIEAIAAFVLLALFLGTLMSALSTSMRNTLRAEQESLAAQWAQSKLDLVGIGEKLEPGVTRGEFDDGYRWEMAVEEYEPVREQEPEIPVDLDALGMRLYRVDLDVFWGDGDNAHTRFTTLRAYSPDQAVLFNQTDAGEDGSAVPPGMRGNNAGLQPRQPQPVRPRQDGAAVR